jgi:tryptophan synthase beta chain
MGAEDMARQAPNVLRMRLLGATVRQVDAGSRTLKDAINEAMRDWVATVADTYYLLGSVLGPHPYPLMVREFQSFIGREARGQLLAQAGQLPEAVVACVGGGSNAMGIFDAFVAGRRGAADWVGSRRRGHRARAAMRQRFAGGSVGILQGTKTWVLQTAHGNIELTHSILGGARLRGRGARARLAATAGPD